VTAPADPPAVPRGYQVRNRLGSGRTAHVYLARHERYGEVALKLPREELAAKPVLRRMFENEVMITLKLDGERVVRALDGKSTGAGAFLALEVCPGGTLDQLLLEQGRLPLRVAVRLVEDVAEGLAFAHEAKVLHRDVKPANVFLTDQGRAKLGDFGTGSFMTDPSDERVGTAFYMAPELFEGRPSSVASDVYSLGVLAFEVLTGERPFRGESYEALMHEHLAGLLRDPRTVRGDLSDDLARVVRVAMARSPQRRYATVSAFLVALREATPGLRDPATRPGPTSGRATRVGAAPTLAPPGRGAEKADQHDDRRTSSRSPWWRRLFGRGDESGS
jgi:serine/threonine-protein kinase